MNRDSRRIVHDSRYPIGGSRDRRFIARDSDPTVSRPALVQHLRQSMGGANFDRACVLLDNYVNDLLGLGGGELEGDPSAMDSRVHDRTATSLAEMFPDLKAPMKI